MRLECWLCWLLGPLPYKCGYRRAESRGNKQQLSLICDLLEMWRSWKVILSQAKSALFCSDSASFVAQSVIKMRLRAYMKGITGRTSLDHDSLYTTNFRHRKGGKVDTLEVNTNTCAAPISHINDEASFSASTAPSSDGLTVAPELRRGCKTKPCKPKFTNAAFVSCVLSAALR